MNDTPTALGGRRRFLKTTGLLSLAGMAPSLGRQALASTAPGPGSAQDIIMADALSLSNWIAQRQVSCREVMVA
ncbi:MAG: amidase, partial [Alcaligenes sp.]|nr:amidase [Alcaligenes sp.]